MSQSSRAAGLLVKGLGSVLQPAKGCHRTITNVPGFQMPVRASDPLAGSAPASTVPSATAATASKQADRAASSGPDPKGTGPGASHDVRGLNIMRTAANLVPGHGEKVCMVLSAWCHLPIMRVIMHAASMFSTLQSAREQACMHACCMPSFASACGFV